MTQSRMMIETHDADHGLTAYGACDLRDTFGTETATQFDGHAAFVDEVLSRAAGTGVI